MKLRIVQKYSKILGQRAFFVERKLLFFWAKARAAEFYMKHVSLPLPFANVAHAECAIQEYKERKEKEKSKCEVIKEYDV